MVAKDLLAVGGDGYQRLYYLQAVGQKKRRPITHLAFWRKLIEVLGQVQEHHTTLSVFSLYVTTLRKGDVIVWSAVIERMALGI